MPSTLFSLQGLFRVIQIAIVPVIFFYIVFAFVMMRQIKLLNKSISTPAAPALEGVALIHLVLSIAIALFALTSL
jgi:flagellar biosynthesis protein FlhB